MNEQSTHLVRAVSGPIILITIGVLFAFDRFTEFRFSQTWPVLLIVAGLLKLLGGFRGGRRNRDFYNSRPNPPQPPPPPPPAPDSARPNYAPPGSYQSSRYQGPGAQTARDKPGGARS